MGKNGQVWIETVLYALIAIALIGLILAFVTPKIKVYKDKLAVEQTIEALNVLDEKVIAVSKIPGNIRVADLKMQRGELIINSSNDEISFVFSDLKQPYSEPGVELAGRPRILSLKGEKESKMIISYRYNQNITFMGADKEKRFPAAASAYSFSITNLGSRSSQAKVQIDVSESSRA